jgi:monoamine oxidase
MSYTRRDFIKFVVVGSVASGCPMPESLQAIPLDEKRSPRIEGEHNEICHQVRDGREFARPEPTRKTGILIIGGGMAGLSAAYFLRDSDFLILEKESHFGGNAYEEEFEDQPFATGSAFAWRGSPAEQLANELGITLLPVNNPDPTIVNGTWVADTWNTGIEHLPYPKQVRESFRKFRDDMRKIQVRERMRELDLEPFSKYTAPYSPELTHWWDAYGPSNWGAVTRETSAYMGISEIQGLAGVEPDTRVILPGGLGCITHKLVEVLQPKYGERMIGGAAVVSVWHEKDGVRATYFRDGQLTTVAAKAAIYCAPKLIASRTVMDLSAEQKVTMRKIRYAPYPVVNLIFDKPVYNRGYDTWCPGNSFTDFIVADWTVRNQPGYRQKNNILTVYACLPPEQRAILLTEDSCKEFAARVLSDFQKLLPEFNVDPIEVRLYRRGHPMFMTVPGQFTQIRPAAAQPMERIYFGNADSGGPESQSPEAIRLSRVGAEWARMVLAGKPGARELAQKALASVAD